VYLAIDSPQAMAPSTVWPIGISVVKLLSIKKNILYIENVDILNGTPLLNIKPYIPDFDIHQVEKMGWLENKCSEKAKTISDLLIIFPSAISSAAVLAGSSN